MSIFSLKDHSLEDFLRNYLPNMKDYRKMLKSKRLKERHLSGPLTDKHQIESLKQSILSKIKEIEDGLQPGANRIKYQMDRSEVLSAFKEFDAVKIDLFCRLYGVNNTVNIQKTSAENITLDVDGEGITFRLKEPDVEEEEEEYSFEECRILNTIERADANVRGLLSKVVNPVVIGITTFVRIRTTNQVVNKICTEVSEATVKSLTVEEIQ